MRDDALQVLHLHALLGRVPNIHMSHPGGPLHYLRTLHAPALQSPDKKLPFRCFKMLLFHPKPSFLQLTAVLSSSCEMSFRAMQRSGLQRLGTLELQ